MRLLALTSLAVALAGCGGSSSPAPAGSSCSFVGTFATVLPNGGTATLVNSSAGTFVLTIEIPNQPITTIDGNYALSGSQVTLTNTSASPSSVQGCIGQAAVYALTWNGSCSQVTFQKVSDACQGRMADANGSTLTRQ